MVEMYRLIESIEINAPPERVFQFLSDIRSRMELSPSYKLLKFELLTPGPVRKGTRFKATIEAEGKIVEYISEVSGFTPPRKIVLKRVDGGLKLTLKLKRTSRGTTLLTHDEEFELPQKLTDIPETEEKTSTGSILKDIAEAIKDLAFLLYGHPEEVKAREQLIEKLRKDLREWLRRIKVTVESGT